MRLGLSGLFSSLTGGDRSGRGGGIAALANRAAGAKLGLSQAVATTRYKPVTEARQRTVREDAYADRPVTRTEAVTRREAVTEAREVYETRPLYEERATFEDRPTFEDRAVYEDQAVYEDRAVFERRDVFEDRAVYEDRAVFEDRAVYEDRAIYQDRAIYEDRAIRKTEVDGSKSIAGYRSLSQAKIDTGADFSLKVGGGALAVVKFESGSKISMTTGGVKRQFAYTSAAGSFGEAVRAAIDSVDGLTATLTADGKLKLETDNAQTLKIDEVANGLFDLSGSPLDKLGLKAGTTEAKVVGTERVQTGTERVQTGTERVQTGTERVQTGTERVQTGTQRVKVGEEDIQTGTERVQTGTRRVQTGTERVQTGTERVATGTERVQVGEERVRTGTETVTTGYSDVTASKTVTTTERVKTGTVERVVDDGRAVIGLVPDTNFAIGLFGLLGGNAGPGFDYVGALFKPLELAEAPRNAWIAAYAEADRLGRRDDGSRNAWQRDPKDREVEATDDGGSSIWRR